MGTHDGHRKRMRDRLLSGGPLADHELLEIALFYSIPRANTNGIAHELLERFGSLGGVFSASVTELMHCSGIGERSAQLLLLMGELHRRTSVKNNKSKDTLANSADAVSYVSSLFHSMRNERLYVISLDSRYRVLGADVVSEGTIDEAAVYPRRVLWAALSRNASSVVIAHNHPGGSPEPSLADIDMTMSLSSLFSSVGISLSDHIIVSDEGYYCFSTEMSGNIEELSLKAAQYRRSNGNKK